MDILMVIVLNVKLEHLLFKEIQFHVRHVQQEHIMVKELQVVQNVKLEQYHLLDHLHAQIVKQERIQQKEVHRVHYVQD